MVQADGRFDLERGRNDGDATDCFGAPTFIRFGSNTNPKFQWWDGNPVKMEIHSISASGNPITYAIR
jgi:hypothetical protein